MPVSFNVHDSTTQWDSLRVQGKSGGSCVGVSFVALAPFFVCFAVVSGWRLDEDSILTSHRKGV